METARVTRKNAGAFPWMRALVLALFVLFALQKMPFYPPILIPVFALGAAALAVFVPAVAVLFVVVALSLPLMAANLGIGLAFLLIGLAASQYLGQGNARTFLVVALAFVASTYNAGWALAVIAGFGLGASEGAVVALLACITIQVVGLVFGREAVGLVATGGIPPGLVSFTDVSAGSVLVGGEEFAALGFKWLGPAFSALDLGSLFDALGKVQHLGLLVAQPIIWAVSAGITGGLTRPVGDPKRLPMAFVSVAVGVAAILGASAAGLTAAGVELGGSTLVTGAALSLGLALLYVVVSELVFPRSLVELSRSSASLHAEDADVDELLRVISTAEDELAAKHTVEATVLITDMKSFSAMTEMDGSVLTAKTIQRHRDLLLPVMSRHGGSGKSTGGDGLLAAFERPSDAVAAAIDMQKALVVHNAAHPTDRPMSIRIGMAHGEVVVDKHGRPFIGDALNKAARIMDLGDGGQIYAEGTVMRMTPAPPPTVDHGPHTVKNIHDALSVIEIMWRDGQVPEPPRRSRRSQDAAVSDAGSEDDTRDKGGTRQAPE